LMKTFEYQPIGVIRSPFKALARMPIQPAGARGVTGRVEVYPEFAPGLKDLGGFSHVVLVYHLHKSKGYRLEVVPYLDTEQRGLFATRAPRRPNPIGISVVRLTGVKGNVLEIDGIDVLDKTPLLDIKPYVPEFDKPEKVRTGWLAKAKGRARLHRSDGRFAR
jgi:tRNA-Thr(GGU) m(6)t(6)A37 methyltransferase TsaA